MSQAALSRRGFLRLGALATAGLVIGLRLPRREDAEAADAAAGQGRGTKNKALADPATALEPNAWLRVAPDGTVTVWCAHSEMGQGVWTSMPMLVAEELDVDLAQVHVEQALADEKYGEMGTGGSYSVRGSWTPLRKAGAAARAMLVAAAAKQWSVEPSSCRTERGSVLHAASGRRLTYGALATAASREPVPQDPPLKDPSQFRILGTRAPRLELPNKVDGSAVFGLDLRVPGMLYAAVARSPVLGGKAVSFDDSRARKLVGVRWVGRCGDGVAVAAESTWAALQARDALDVKWDEGPNAAQSSAAIRARMEELAKRPGAVARKEGKGAEALAGAARRIEAVYEVPFQSHAPMEPTNCTAHVRADGCEVWAPTQTQTEARAAAAKVAGVPVENVILHTTFLGGGFGRHLEVDDVIEAVTLSKAVGAPIKVVWTREDELQHDFYRPATYNVLSAGFDERGAPLVWTHRIVGPSILQRAEPQAVKNGIDPSSISGAANLPYRIPHLQVEYALCDTGIPVGFWRSVGSSQNAFVVESFMDEVAAAAKRDPLELRRELLPDKPRMRAVLELAAEKAGWGKPLPEGRGRGIAAHQAFGSYVAQVAEVSVRKDGAVRVHRVVCAVDCGMTVNPDTIEAQMEGGIAFGLTAALKSAITIDKGRVVQSNFHDFPLLHMDEMPAIEVYIVPSKEAPGGIGEPGVPPVAPAVVNALFAATGKRVRKLPVQV